jgi:hypothetical protein
MTLLVPLFSTERVNRYFFQAGPPFGLRFQKLVANCTNNTLSFKLWCSSSLIS